MCGKISWVFLEKRSLKNICHCNSSYNFIFASLATRQLLSMLHTKSIYYSYVTLLYWNACLCPWKRPSDFADTMQHLTHATLIPFLFYHNGNYPKLSEQTCLPVRSVISPGCGLTLEPFKMCRKLRKYICWTLHMLLHTNN